MFTNRRLRTGTGRRASVDCRYAIDLLEPRLLLSAAISNLASFNSNERGQFPEDALISSGNTLYGTTYGGGPENYGTVFSVPITGGAPTTLAYFSSKAVGVWPVAGLILSGNTLYGTTSEGGSGNDGVIFSLSTTGGTVAVLASFLGSNGDEPDSTLLLSGTTLYGTTILGGADNDGTVYSLPITGGTPDVLASFNRTDGYDANSSLILSGTTLYGVTGGGGALGDGVVFSLPITGGIPNGLASFNGADGAFPDGGLLLSGSTLYGTTSQGGSASDGTVFSLPIAGGTPGTLASFGGSTNGMQVESSLILSGSNLYGAAESGGPSGDGTVFSVPFTGGIVSVLAAFNGADGANPDAGLLLVGSELYGTAYGGGSANEGAVFSVPLTGGTPTVLTQMGIDDGYEAEGGLIFSGGTIYGTTSEGGADNDGEVYSLPVSGGFPTILASFDGTDGENPEAALLLSGATLYGTTTIGGANGDGAVFSLPISGGTPTVLASFNLTDGLYPDSNLILSGTTLYGTTQAGGAFGNSGTIFSLPITGGTPNDLASFNFTDGSDPTGGLILSGTTFYGTTTNGGSNDDGTVFSLSITGGTPQDLCVFNGSDGEDPECQLVLLDGYLYGTTFEGGGSADDGVVFSVPATGGMETVLATFNGSNGSNPQGGLTVDPAGNLYGTTTSGGTYNAGVVYQVSVGMNTFSVDAPFPRPFAPDCQSSMIADAHGNLYGTGEGAGYYGMGEVFMVTGTGFVTDVWVGGTSNAWNNPANWSKDAMPGLNDNPYIGGATVNAPAGINTGILTLSNATLKLGSYTGESILSGLIIGNNGVLDIQNNMVIINYGSGSDPRSTILSDLFSGSNDGAWNGTMGIISSTAAVGANYGVGFADGADGVDSNLASGQIEISYAQYGDITLQGSVNAADFSILSANFGRAVTNGWESGDFTYQGAVNSQDFSLLSADFGQTGIGEETESPLAVFATSSVPTSTANTMAIQPWANRIAAVIVPSDDPDTGLNSIGLILNKPAKNRGDRRWI